MVASMCARAQSNNCTNVNRHLAARFRRQLGHKDAVFDMQGE